MTIQAGLVAKAALDDIGDALREKLNTEDTFKPSEMGNAIRTINNTFDSIALTVTSNGKYSPPAGKDGFSRITVTVGNTYPEDDYGKVVEDGILVDQTRLTVSDNGLFTTTTNNEVLVAIPEADDTYY